MSGSKRARQVTAVIVTYQSGPTVGRALEGARRCYDAGLLDVVIVDNNSVDATRGIVGRVSDWTRTLYLDRNNGFGRGCNVGLGEVTSPYTLFLNPDAVIEPDAVRTMLEFMEQHAYVGIVGPAIVEGDGDSAASLQETGERLTPRAILKRAIPLLKGGAKTWPILPGSQPVRTGWVCGAVFMIRTELMKRLQGFDPRFFLYWEEIDVCKRADDIGFETWALGAAVAHHVGGASSPNDDTKIDGCIATHYYQSRYYYMVKHHGRLAASVAEVGEFILLGIMSIVDLAQGRRKCRLRPRLQAPLFSQPDGQ